MTSSSELRDEAEFGFRGGEFELVGAFEPRHCAAWEGTVTVVIVLAAFVFCRAILRRLARLELCDNCVFETVREFIAYDIVSCALSEEIASQTFDLRYCLLPSPGSFSSLTDIRAKRDSSPRLAIVNKERLKDSLGCEE